MILNILKAFFTLLLLTLSYFAFTSNLEYTYLTRCVITLLLTVAFVSLQRPNSRWLAYTLGCFTVGLLLYTIYLLREPPKKYDIIVIGAIIYFIGYVMILLENIRRFKKSFLKGNELTVYGIFFMLLFVAGGILFYVGDKELNSIQNIIVIAYLFMIILISFFAFANFIALTSQKTLWMFIAVLILLLSEFAQAFIYVVENQEVSEMVIVATLEHIFPVIGVFILYKYYLTPTKYQLHDEIL
ncbi:hypothetical protein GCM10009117_19510 [Gangjinia marincola]|uniref:YhhN-like protein n=1 Tax=Gangjinia marincola TaxID=578463 RepID=A0ABN1MIW4_9FLAO